MDSLSRSRQYKVTPRVRRVSAAVRRAPIRLVDTPQHRRWTAFGSAAMAVVAVVVMFTASVTKADAPAVANLWVDGSTTGSCTVQGGAGGAYQSGQGCRDLGAAYTKASSGQTVRVLAGSYSSVNISGSKAVAFIGAGTSTVLGGVDFSSATGSSIDSMRIDGEVNAITSSTITISNSTINQAIYFAGNNGITFDHNLVEATSSATYWNNNDMIDIYPAGTGNNPNIPNHNITISNSTFHGLRGQSFSGQAYQHPDTIQSYNNGAPHTGIKLLNNKFYDNECINLRTNPADEYTIENNVFGSSAYINGCGDYSIDVGYANVTARYNTFVGGQPIQETPNVSGTHQTWIGNVGAGFSAGCGSGGASGATISRNVWTDQKCNSSDTKTTNLLVNSDFSLASYGSLQANSPAYGAGDVNSYPPLDLLGNTRALFNGAPDAGAIATHITGGGPPSDTTPPTVSVTAPTAGATVSGASVAITATASDDVGVAGVQFVLDGTTNIGAEDTGTPFATTWDTTGVANGSHTITAVARDAATNSTTSAGVAVTVNNISAPTNSVAPVVSGTTNVGQTLSVTNGTWSGSPTSYAYQWQRCTSGGTGCADIAGQTATTYRLAASDYAHKVQVLVTATNSAGSNVATSNQTGVVGDTVAPAIAFTSPTTNAFVGRTVVLSVDVSDNVAIAGVTYKIDGINIGSEVTNAPYSLSWDSTTTSEVAHTFTAVARDVAGNTTSTTATTVTVDNTAPDTMINGGPDSSTLSTEASFLLASTETGSFECQLDGGGFASCANPYVISGLGAGDHTVAVRALDQAGNVDPTAASYNWVVTSPPTSDDTSAGVASTTSGSSAQPKSSNRKATTVAAATAAAAPADDTPDDATHSTETSAAAAGQSGGSSSGGSSAGSSSGSGSGASSGSSSGSGLLGLLANPLALGVTGVSLLGILAGVGTWAVRARAAASVASLLTPTPPSVPSPFAPSPEPVASVSPPSVPPPSYGPAPSSTASPSLNFTQSSSGGVPQSHPVDPLSRP
jgi:hypothetical protein